MVEISRTVLSTSELQASQDGGHTITWSATAHVRQIPEAMINYDIPLVLKLNVQCSRSEQCLLTECSVAMTTVLTITCSSYTNMY